MTAPLCAVLAVAALLAGCGAPAAPKGTTDSAGSRFRRPPASVTGTITVFAASSLQQAFTRLGARFQIAHPGTKVVFSFGPSSGLAEQIRQGAPADLFASASTPPMARVVSSGDAGAAVNFATNKMDIAVPPNNPADIRTVADLARKGVKVALCQAQVPCGATARQVFAKAGVDVVPVTEEIDVKSTMSKVTLGEVDAGVVYVTDVLAAGAAAKGIPIPDDVNASTTYPIAPLTGSKNKATAQAFVDYVLSGDGAAVLTAAGFGKP